MKKTNKSNPKVAVYILAFMAFIFTAVGGAFLYFANEFNDKAVSTTGWVVNVSINYNDGSTTYKPTISYMDENGIKQTGQTFLSSSTYNFPRGAEVEILYDPSDPSSIRMNSWFALWAFPIIFLGVGILLAVIALIVALTLKKRKLNAARGGANRQKPEATYSYSSNESDDERQPTIRRR